MKMRLQLAPISIPNNRPRRMLGVTPSSLDAPRLGPSAGLGPRLAQRAGRPSVRPGAESRLEVRVAPQLLRDQVVDRARRVFAVGGALAGWSAGEDLDPLVDVSHRPDAELAVAYRFDDIVGEHEVTHVGRGDHHPLV